MQEILALFSFGCYVFRFISLIVLF